MEPNKYRNRAIWQILLCGLFVFYGVLFIFIDSDDITIGGKIMFIIFCALFALIFYASAAYSYDTYKELCELKNKNPSVYYNKMMQKEKEDEARKIQEKKEQEIRIQQQKQREIEIKNKVRRLKAEGKVCCPRCGSESVAAGTRGFTITTGFVGSGKVRVICLNCGYKWKPKR